MANLLRDTMHAAGYDHAAIDRYGSVVGHILGKMPGKTVLLDGHIDTVGIPEIADWTHDPFGGEIIDGKLFGRGASDMKASVAAMTLAAAWFAADTGQSFAGSLCVSGTVHEECFEGVAAREVTRAIKPDWAIVGEATGLTLKIGQRGRAEVVIETFGIPCHSANPEKGINAVYRMCRVIEAMRRLVPDEHPVLGKGIYELTDIVSAPYPGASVVPQRCRATFDHRLLPGESRASVLAQVEAAVREAAGPGPATKVSIAADTQPCWTGEMLSADRFFPAWLIPEEDELVLLAQKGLANAGICAPLSHFSFCTNGSHFCGEVGIPTIGFGPSQEHLAHTVDEYIELTQLYAACQGYYAILAALTQYTQENGGDKQPC